MKVVGDTIAIRDETGSSSGESRYWLTRVVGVDFATDTLQVAPEIVAPVGSGLVLYQFNGCRPDIGRIESNH